MLPQACLTLRVIIENPEEKKKKKHLVEPRGGQELSEDPNWVINVCRWHLRTVCQCICWWIQAQIPDPEIYLCRRDHLFGGRLLLLTTWWCSDISDFRVKHHWFITDGPDLFELLWNVEKVKRKSYCKLRLTCIYSTVASVLSSDRPEDGPDFPGFS